MSTVFGFVPARDLGDGQIEPWEQTGSGTLPVWPSEQQCRADIARWGADPQVWRVFALVDTAPDRALPGRRAWTVDSDGGRIEWREYDTDLWSRTDGSTVTDTDGLRAQGATIEEN